MPYGIIYLYRWENKMDEVKKLTELQIKHRQQMKENRDKTKARKERTHRLIVRGAMAENLIENASSMTDEQFQLELTKLLGS